MICITNDTCLIFIVCQPSHSLAFTCSLSLSIHLYGNFVVDLTSAHTMNGNGTASDETDRRCGGAGPENGETGRGKKVK